MARGIWKRSTGLTTLLVLEFACFLFVSYQIQVEEHLSLLEKMALTVVGPFQHLSNETSSFIEQRTQRSKSLDQLAVENRQLTLKVSHLNRIESQLEEERLENERLRELLALPRPPGWRTVIASVIGRSNRGDDEVLFISRGSLSGVERDMGVLSPAGVVGVVWEVSPYYSKIMTVNNPATAIACMIQSSRYADAYLIGLGSNMGRLENVPNFATVSLGDKVVTSGLDGLFPKGEPIGSVLHVKPSSQMFLDIRVHLGVPFSTLEEVIVLMPTETSEPKTAIP